MDPTSDSTDLQIRCMSDSLIMQWFPLDKALNFLEWFWSLRNIPCTFYLNSEPQIKNKWTLIPFLLHFLNRHFSQEFGRRREGIWWISAINTLGTMAIRYLARARGWVGCEGDRQTILSFCSHYKQISHGDQNHNIDCTSCILQFFL